MAAGDKPGSTVYPVGRVLTLTRNSVLVEDAEGEAHLCRVPGKGRTFGMPIPGDSVRFTPSIQTGDGWVQEILPRETLFRRYVFGRIKEIAANMERLVLMATPSMPVVSPRMVDRMLAGASAGGLEALIVINKMDILDPGKVEAWVEPWKIAGYAILYTSALTGAGLDSLEETLSGKVSLLSGASGVGKSTLLNRLIKDLNLTTNVLSVSTGRGVHTTSFTRLFALPDTGWVADSPGLREFHPVLEADEIRQHFHEFKAFADDCEFQDCLHLNEPDCGVIRAVEKGQIHPRRYESYKILYHSLKEGPKRGRHNPTMT